MEFQQHKNKTFTGIDFFNQTIQYCEFFNCKFVDCYFCSSTIKYCDFYHSSFSGCSFLLSSWRFVDLLGTEFRHCRLDKSVFSHVDFFCSSINLTNTLSWYGLGLIIHVLETAALTAEHQEVIKVLKAHPKACWSEFKNLIVDQEQRKWIYSVLSPYSKKGSLETHLHKYEIPIPV